MSYSNKPLLIHHFASQGVLLTLRHKESEILECPPALCQMPPRTFTAKHSSCNWRDQSLNICTHKSFLHIFVQMIVSIYINVGLLWWLSGKKSACRAGDLGLIPGLRRSPGGGYDNPLQYSCPKNPMDRGAWWATVYRVTQSQTRLKWLSSSSMKVLVPQSSLGSPPGSSAHGILQARIG